MEKRVQIGPYNVDGQCKCCKKKIFEFYGCHYHGCPGCMTRRKQKVADISGPNAEEAYQYDRKSRVFEN